MKENLCMFFYLVSYIPLCLFCIRLNRYLMEGKNTMDAVAAILWFDLWGAVFFPTIIVYANVA